MDLDTKKQDGIKVTQQNHYPLSLPPLLPSKHLCPQILIPHVLISAHQLNHQFGDTRVLVPTDIS